MPSSKGVLTKGQGFFGERICKHLQMSGTLLAGVPPTLELPFAVTHLNCSKLRREKTEAIPAEDAFSILHQLKDLEGHDCWTGGQKRFSGAFAAGTASVMNLHNNPQCAFTGTFEALQFYVPRVVLDDFFYEHNGGIVDTLRWPRDQDDPTLAALSRVLLAVTEQSAAASQLFLDQLGLSVIAHVAQSYGGLNPRRSRAEPGLAPWQQRRAVELMHARISDQITMEEIARECQLTPSHFSRAFRLSFGSAPHRYLADLRVTEAKRLMTGTALPLADIALMCGFAEQSHLTRVFSRLVGASPGAWRHGIRT